MNILVLYYSRTGKTLELANLIARGIELEDIDASIRTVPPINDNSQDLEHDIVTANDLEECSGLALGSPTRFGTMASPLKYFFEQNAALWHKGALIDKPACVFTATGSMHGGQESTLLSMSLPLLHHGMALIGIPYSVNELSTTNTGGTPYGASHVSGIYDQNEISQEEHALCLALGKRLARHAKLLHSLRG
ncbi:MAG: NAD(P)H:quinone oxidoreductase [Francisellaceae bacterium]|jgi:NAD(P)H dehydrogenase (quinone)|nr:NAD(P)H:quinone oxidoreductase [Francisellaceae bacterium]MBT6206951.1 NAD(P)H:quinone oxidoreductase [Francisellaceae bacterium]MBT6538471.1 NAD(P)H:quinone oxidoreductase [Francisellaceae bacterium]